MPPMAQKMTMTHPDLSQLADYLDDALDSEVRAVVRAHTLTCPSCTAQLNQLRRDSQRIPHALAHFGPAPDVRVAVRARLRRPGATVWVLRGVALAAGLVALLFFALLLDVSGGGSVSRIPDRLFVTDSRNGRLITLAAYDGAQIGELVIGERPTKVRYDPRRDRLYVLLGGGVAAVNPRQLEVLARWRAPQPLDGEAGMALDTEGGRLYVTQPGGIAVLDTENLALLREYLAGPAPGPLALAPDRRTLYSLDRDEATLWTIDLGSGAGSARLLDRNDVGYWGWLALSPDGGRVYVLRAGAPPLLRAIDVRTGREDALAPVDAPPNPQDLLTLPDGRLAIARGDGTRGGVLLLDGETLQPIARLDPDRDQHNLVGAPGEGLFALNWLYGYVTRYDLRGGTVLWRISLPGAKIQDGVFVYGGWRWPFG